MGAKVCEYFWGDFLGTEIWENIGAISNTDLTSRNATINYGDIPSGEEGGGGCPPPLNTIEFNRI